MDRASALTSFSVYAADDAFSLTGESDYGMSSWSMSYDIDNAGARDYTTLLSPSDRYFSDTDHGKEKLLLPMEISDLLDKDVAPYLQVKDVSLESEPKIKLEEIKALFGESFSMSKIRKANIVYPSQM